ncbi:MAG: hypothetical protein V4438_02765 [Patescibacteria group bacterium]
MKTVLVIEDSAILRHAIEAASVDWAETLSFLYAEDFAEGIKLLGENPDLDVIILDVRLPDGRSSSDNFARIIREEHFFKGLLVASSAQPGYADEMIQQGCDLFVDKEKLGEYLSSLSKGNYVIVADSNSGWKDQWVKALGPTVTVKEASTIDTLLDAVAKFKERIKLLVFPEEFLSYEGGGQTLLERIFALGFEGPIFLTYIGEGKVCEKGLPTRIKKMSRIDLGRFLASDSLRKSLVAP